MVGCVAGLGYPNPVSGVGVFLGQRRKGKRSIAPHDRATKELVVGGNGTFAYLDICPTPLRG